MLSIKNVTKVYDTKGVIVKALDDVSVDFPERGMVFLLGKSGSGKSTLLNVSGGLDMPDSGEIILKGKSSKDFSPADFDSYRNTFVGFIFQEYNILTDFSVEENISLALELQGKTKDEKTIDELLELVDLKGFGKRKPNTLSGGQKQRIAIARALVKNPEIIMADEPTGALDSVTGSQVLDTLKKLSENKLVLVVSHDREFAETYGDRIIELKDGKIISDKTKVKERFTDTANLTFVGENTISIKSGSKLSGEDIDKINEFLLRSEKDVFITAEESEVKSMKKIASIDDSNAKSSFVPTDESLIDQKEYDGSKVTFIKSKLPVRHAVRLGTSSLRIKPFKLLFTALLSTVAFIIFGLLSTLLTYSETKIYINALQEEEYTAAVATRSVSVEYRYYYHYFDEFETMQYVTDEETVGVASVNAYYSQEDVDYVNSLNKNFNFAGVYTFNRASDPIYTKYGIRWFEASSVSYYYYKNGYINGFCDLSDRDLSDFGLTLIAGEYPSDGRSVAVPSYYADMVIKAGGILDPDDTDVVIPIYSYEELIGQRILLRVGSFNEFDVTVSGIVDCGAIPSKYDVLMTVTDTRVNKLYGYGGQYTHSQITSLINKLSSYYDNSFLSVFLVNGDFYETNKAAASIISDPFLDLCIANSDIREIITKSEEEKENMLMTEEEYNRQKEEWDRNNVRTYAIVSDYKPSDENIYQKIIMPVQNGSSEQLKAFADLINSEHKNGDLYKDDYSVVSSAVSDATETVGIMIKILLPAGLLLALFAALLLSNFIAVSINNKEKDIGILRAVGARGMDVFKIFLSEALVITCICFALATIGSGVLCSVVNAFLIQKAIIEIPVFYFSGIDVVIIFVISVITAALSTYLPVRKAVKKKPVEAIRSL